MDEYSNGVRAGLSLCLWTMIFTGAAYGIGRYTGTMKERKKWKNDISLIREVVECQEKLREASIKEEVKENETEL